MQLRDAFPVEADYEQHFADRPIAGICVDSRKVRPGDAFVALAGHRTDGARFIADALGAGAAAVVAEHPPAAPLPDATAFVRVPNARRALALAAARFHPRQPRVIAAVTGTSGKTSVVAFARQLWQSLGYQAASIGTVGVVAPRGEVYGSLTTPDPVALHATIDRLAGEGVTHLALEASSHGIEQHRLDGVQIGIAAFTNLSRDHLDYHATLDQYFDAKRRLFSELLRRGGTAVVNTDDARGAAVVASARMRDAALLTVGRGGDATIAIEAIEPVGFAQRVKVRHNGKTFGIRLPLVGGFQVENALVAAALALAAGGAAVDVFAAMGALRGAKGRLEHVGTHKGAPIFVDYAHKPDALAKALDALRPYVRGRLIVVFGAGGDRDQGKRPIMGAIAAAKADRVIVTDDNPRGESAGTIRAAILAGAPGATEIGDRGEAISTAIADLKEGDVLLIAGKGHESGQIVGDKTLPFSDHDAIAAALKERAA